MDGTMFATKRAGAALIIRDFLQAYSLNFTYTSSCGLSESFKGYNKVSFLTSPIHTLQLEVNLEAFIHDSFLTK